MPLRTSWHAVLSPGLFWQSFSPFGVFEYTFPVSGPEISSPHALAPDAVPGTVQVLPPLDKAPVCTEEYKMTLLLEAMTRALESLESGQKFEMSSYQPVPLLIQSQLNKRLDTVRQSVEKVILMVIYKPRVCG